MTYKTLTFAAFALNGAIAADLYSPIDTGCLIQTDSHGTDSLDYPNMELYRRSNFTTAGITANMRITMIKTCYQIDFDDDTERLTGFAGFSLTLSDPSYDGPQERIELPYMGNPNYDYCEEELVGEPGITGITTYQDVDYYEKVQGISWFSDHWGSIWGRDEDWTHWENHMNLKHWRFDDPDTPVMGMYGKVEDGRIYQLGWIKLDL